MRGLQRAPRGWTNSDIFALCLAVCFVALGILLAFASTAWLHSLQRPSALHTARSSAFDWPNAKRQSAFANLGVHPNPRLAGAHA